MKSWLLKFVLSNLILITSFGLFGQKGCLTDAGTMTSTATVQLCDDECTDMVTHNGDENLDGDDLLQFVVHTGTNPAVPLARNSTPEFCFSQVLGGEYGVTYYISAIAGNDIGGIVSVSDPCYSQSIGTPVVWFETPIAFISDTELDFCGIEGTLVATPPQSGLTGTWSSALPFVAAGGTTINDPTVNVVAGDHGNYVFTWTVVNGPCSASDNINVEFIEMPVAYAGDNFAICGNEATLQGTQSVTGSICQWTGNGSFASATSFNTDVTGGVYGEVTFTIRESVGSCWDEADVIVNFIQAPSPAVIATFDTVCNNTGNLQVLNVIGSGSWAAWYDGSLLVPAPDFNPGISNPVTSVTIPNYPITEYHRTVEFIWTETTSGGGQTCTESVSTFLTFSREPIASVPFDQAETCGNTYQLAAEVTGSEWATGIWISPQISNPFDDASLPDATVTIPVPGSYGDSAYVTAPFIWAMTNTGCTTLDTMNVTFYRRPVANAGLDREICGNNSILGAVYSLPETGNYSPQGIWSVASRPDVAALADINPLTSDTANVTVSHVGTWRFVFRENNDNLTSCYSTDTVQITFIETPVISAGDDKDVCGSTTTLEAISGGATGTWLPNGTAIANFNNPNSSVTSPSYGSINFIWLESNEFCSALDTVTITFWRQPTANILTDEADSTVCGLTFNNLRAENSGDGITGYWYNINPATVYGDAFAVNTWATVPNYGYHNFYWIEQTGPELEPGFCNDTAGPLRIHFIQVPTANAGGDTLFCGRSGYLNAIPSIGTGVWTTPSTGLVVVENQNDPTTYIESEITNTGNPTYPYFTLIWTEDNTNGCTDRDTMQVVFARVPTSELDIIPPKCFGEPATIAAAEDSLPQYTWNFYTGLTDSVTTNTVGGSYQNFVFWSSTDTAHRVSMIATNSFGCQSPITVDTVFEPAIPTFDVTLIQDTCSLGKGAIIFGDTLGTSAFFWLDPNVGPPVMSPVTTISSLPVGEYSIHTSYLTPNIVNYAYYILTFGTANCIDTFSYEIEPIGMIDAEMAVSADVLLEELIAPEATVIFMNTSDYDDVSKRCEWHFDDGTIVKSCDPLVEHMYVEAGCYNPFLIVMNRDLPECRDTAKLEECIFVDDASKIEVPNVFSPNGDGINDFFQVKAQTLKTFNGVITNRWGNAVYEWSDWETYESGWDGTIGGGSKASPGVYFYVIKAEGIDGIPYDLHGVLHLMKE